MSEVTTKYGTLKGATYASRYPNGTVRDCILIEPNQIDTPYGPLVPQYLDDGQRRKRIKPLSFHPNGNLKNVPLDSPALIKTSIGAFPAELVTFYENGGLCRIFPLDGNLTGFWTEEDEYSLAEEFEFAFSFVKFKQRIISLHFYESGAVKSLTIWPKDTITLQSPLGTVTARIGISLYEDGTLKSLEPSKPLTVQTQLGQIVAYDHSAHGIHADRNSLSFTKEGKVESVVTSANVITVRNPKGETAVYQPGMQPDMFNPERLEVVPMRINFQGNMVCFENEGNAYDLNECTFTVQPFLLQPETACSECSGCTSCHACG